MLNWLVVCPFSLEDSVCFSHTVNSRLVETPLGRSKAIHPGQKYKEMYGTNSRHYGLPLSQKCGHFMWSKIYTRLKYESWLYSVMDTWHWSYEGITIILRSIKGSLISKYEHQNPKNVQWYNISVGSRPKLFHRHVACAAGVEGEGEGKRNERAKRVSVTEALRPFLPLVRPATQASRHVSIIISCRQNFLGKHLWPLSERSCSGCRFQWS